MAGSSVEFCGRMPDHQLRNLYARCRALVLPGEEDFGITMVEALASGKPVVAWARGGALEIVPERGSILYDRCIEESLGDALRRFDAIEAGFAPLSLRAHAERFSEVRFEEQFSALVHANPGVAARRFAAV